MAESLGIRGEERKQNADLRKAAWGLASVGFSDMVLCVPGNPARLRKNQTNGKNSKMKKSSVMMAAVLLAAAGSGWTAENYPASLKAGDEARAKGDAGAALTEYVTATGQASTTTERALAKGKEATIYAFDKKDYVKGTELAREALEIDGVRPVARVTALQALAECQIKGDKDFKAGTETLNEALELDGVDWAVPSLTLSLGDCLRFSGKNDEAITALEKLSAMPDVSNDMKAVALLNIGCTYQYGLKDGDRAKEAYAKAVALKPALKTEVDGHLDRLP